MTTTNPEREINDKLIGKYFKRLVGRFFKILPMKEGNEDTLNEYMLGLQTELIGFTCLLPPTQLDADYVSLMAILQYLIDSPACGVKTVRREVFTAIPICESLAHRYYPEQAETQGSALTNGTPQIISEHTRR